MSASSSTRLGEDFLRSFDIEFDLAHRTVRLFQPKDCEGASLAYWVTDGAASVITVEPIDAVRPKLTLTVRVNGQSLSA